MKMQIQTNSYHVVSCSHILGLLKCTINKIIILSLVCVFDIHRCVRQKPYSIDSACHMEPQQATAEQLKKQFNSCCVFPHAIPLPNSMMTSHECML